MIVKNTRKKLNKKIVIMELRKPFDSGQRSRIDTTTVQPKKRIKKTNLLEGYWLNVLQGSNMKIEVIRMENNKIVGVGPTLGSRK